jgi:expansin (peptidoglycan-binding protein)
MTKIRNVIVLLLLGVVVVIGVEFMWETAVAQTMEPRAYLPVIINGDPVIGPVHDGIATYYWEADGSGACLFPATPNDLMVAAMNVTEYGNADYCGAYVRVDGRKGSVIVRIVDMCPGCGVGHLDLSPQAFAIIDDIPLGRVPITWQVVSPGIAGPIRFEFKEKNQWWTAVQVRNHRNPIAKFEYWTGSGYKTINRTNYNYFLEASGMGPGPYTFRVTDVLGNQIVSSGIPLSNPGLEIDGSGQFPPP